MLFFGDSHDDAGACEFVELLPYIYICEHL